MRVDSLRNVTAGMAEDAAFCCLVRAGIIKQRRHGVTAVMGSVPISLDGVHYCTPEQTIPVVIVWFAGVGYQIVSA